MNWKCTGDFLGCGRQFTHEEFETWDALTQRECEISGLCAGCQDVVFAEPDEDWEEVPCNCLGLVHRNDCPNWEMPF